MKALPVKEALVPSVLLLFPYHQTVQMQPLVSMTFPCHKYPFGSPSSRSMQHERFLFQGTSRVRKKYSLCIKTKHHNNFVTLILFIALAYVICLVSISKQFSRGCGADKANSSYISGFSGYRGTQI
ncbi:MAG: hypothetical protein [Expellivirus minnis]|uniref:Transmembrane protein n=1 Tax=Cressdnaviricota sp. TaxID=2748378 RepID=A0A345MSR1_9VIRU|nr:MAG: hypothetical protein [Cressdnaviricota sp.]